MSELQKKTCDFQRGLIREMLHQCTEQQVTLFHKLYPKGIPVKDKDIANAYELCERTIKKNQARDKSDGPLELKK